MAWGCYTALVRKLCLPSSLATFCLALVVLLLLGSSTAGCTARKPNRSAEAPPSTARAPFTPSALLLSLRATQSAAATLTAAPTLTSTPTATPSPTPTLTPSATPVPTPFAIVRAPVVEAWRGPATTYESLGRASEGQVLVVLGHSADDAWLWVCCIANQPGWVPNQGLLVVNPLAVAPILTPPPSPTVAPTPTRRPPPTPTLTPLPPFDIARGPEFPAQVANDLLTIYVKVYQGPPDAECALPGFKLKVLRNDIDVSQDATSRGATCAFDSTGPTLGNYLYNLKFEMPAAGEAEWTLFLADASGVPVSPPTTFSTAGTRSRNLVVFIAYFLAR